MKLTGIIIAVLLIASLNGIAQKKNAAYFFAQGQAAFDDNKNVMALAHFNECLRLDPYYWDAYQARASVKDAMGDKKGAMTDYNIFIEARPLDPEALLGRAILRYEAGQYEPAREDFLKLLATPRQPTSKVLFRQTSEGTDKMLTIQSNNHAEFFGYLGLIETRLKDYKRAGVYLDSAVKMAPGSPENFVNRGILREHVQDTAGAIADYEHALKLDPSSSAALHNIAVIRRSRGEQIASETLLDEAILQSPSLPAPYAARAWYRYTHKDYKRALEDYDKALLLDKTDEESWLYRGLTKEKLKDNDGAFVDYTQAITLQNDFAKAWMARGTLLTKLNRLPEAIEDYGVAILWYHEYGTAYYNRGIARQRLNQLKDACADFITAEKLSVKVDPQLKAKACK